MKIYNKLVRDKIPEIIEASGKPCATRCLESAEYAGFLKKKLEEEVAEYLKDGGIEELADILEVVRALAALEGADAAALEAARARKAEARGGFERRILLENVDD